MESAQGKNTAHGSRTPHEDGPSEEGQRESKGAYAQEVSQDIRTNRRLESISEEQESAKNGEERANTGDGIETEGDKALTKEELDELMKIVRPNTKPKASLRRTQQNERPRDGKEEPLFPLIVMAPDEHTEQDVQATEKEAMAVLLKRMDTEDKPITTAMRTLGGRGVLLQAYELEGGTYPPNTWEMLAHKLIASNDDFDFILEYHETMFLLPRQVRALLEDPTEWGSMMRYWANSSMSPAEAISALTEYNTIGVIHRVEGTGGTNNKALQWEVDDNDLQGQLSQVLLVLVIVRSNLKMAIGRYDTVKEELHTLQAVAHREERESTSIRGADSRTSYTTPNLAQANRQAYIDNTIDQRNKLEEMIERQNDNSRRVAQEHEADKEKLQHLRERNLVLEDRVDRATAATRRWKIATEEAQEKHRKLAEIIKEATRQTAEEAETMATQIGMWGALIQSTKPPRELNEAIDQVFHRAEQAIAKMFSQYGLQRKSVGSVNARSQLALDEYKDNLPTENARALREWIIRHNVDEGRNTEEPNSQTMPPGAPQSSRTLGRQGTTAFEGSSPSRVETDGGDQIHGNTVFRKLRTSGERHGGEDMSQRDQGSRYCPTQINRTTTGESRYCRQQSNNPYEQEFAPIGRERRTHEQSRGNDEDGDHLRHLLHGRRVGTDQGSPEQERARENHYQEDQWRGDDRHATQNAGARRGYTGENRRGNGEDSNQWSRQRDGDTAETRDGEGTGPDTPRGDDEQWQSEPRDDYMGRPAGNPHQRNNQGGYSNEQRKYEEGRGYYQEGEHPDQQNRRTHTGGANSTRGENQGEFQRPAMSERGGWQQCNNSLGHQTPITPNSTIIQVDGPRRYDTLPRDKNNQIRTPTDVEMKAALDEGHEISEEVYTQAKKQKLELHSGTDPLLKRVRVIGPMKTSHKLEKFGKEAGVCASRFFVSFEIYMVTQGLYPAYWAMAAIEHLEGQAATTYTECRLTAPGCYPYFKALLMRTTTLSSDSYPAALQLLNAIRMKQGESVDELYERIAAAAVAVANASTLPITWETGEAQKKAALVGALQDQPELLETIRVNMDWHEKDFMHQIMSLRRTYEYLQSKEAKRRPNHDDRGGGNFQGGKKGGKLAFTSQKGGKSQNQASTNATNTAKILPKPPGTPASEVTCYNCNQKGHFATKCPTAPKDKTSGRKITKFVGITMNAEGTVNQPSQDFYVFEDTLANPINEPDGEDDVDNEEQCNMLCKGDSTPQWEGELIVGCMAQSGLRASAYDTMSEEDSQQLMESERRRQFTKGLHVVAMKINGVKIGCAIDTGATVSILSDDIVKYLDKFGDKEMRVLTSKHTEDLRSVNGEPLGINQSVTTLFQLSDNHYADVDCRIVTGVRSMALLGLTDSQKMLGIWLPPILMELQIQSSAIGVPRFLPSDAAATELRAREFHGPRDIRQGWKEVQVNQRMNHIQKGDIQRRETMVNLVTTTEAATNIMTPRPMTLYECVAGLTPHVNIKPEGQSNEIRREYTPASDVVTLAGTTSTPTLVRMADEAPLGKGGLTYTSVRDDLQFVKATWPGHRKSDSDREKEDFHGVSHMDSQR